MLACNIGQYKLENLAKGRFTFGKNFKGHETNVWQNLATSQTIKFILISNNPLMSNFLATGCSIMQIQSKLTVIFPAGEEGGVRYCLECSIPHHVCINCCNTCEHNMPGLSSLRH